MCQIDHCIVHLAEKSIYIYCHDCNGRCGQRRCVYYACSEDEIVLLVLRTKFLLSFFCNDVDKWLNLVENVLIVNLNDCKDSFIWTANKNFLVKNMYNDIVLRVGTPVNCWAWKAKIPLKIKIFLWYLRNGVVLTEENLVKRQWKGCTKFR
jgi:hypothetical protein